MGWARRPRPEHGGRVVKYQRRTDDDRIAELNAKIEGIRVRAARKAAPANPAVKQASLAIKAIERALEAQPDDPL